MDRGTRTQLEVAKAYYDMGMLRDALRAVLDVLDRDRDDAEANELRAKIERALR